MNTDAVAPERDPGLQPERTRLAWRRTTLAFTVAAVLAARQVAGGDLSAAGFVAVACSALVWLGFLRVAHRRVLALGSGPRPPAMSVPAALAAVACTVALAGFAVAMVV
ncbi:hypothetical protein SLUN_07920 [Streptomyces lunaelactis]|uniref:DUF202 domain-containing protein n=1 Tax=Streptomyces lunaelactis TaxID=1535768 RepID=A0A2R4SZ43_9ACTN|nr:DUF202 domain-containing protein [Streptomyces lunaelactis]AVZ72142.1 hypothetical protein SLUN_07920 [Streptomyces lunaelactis]NUL03122.1 DUF202 domain-containing protein [Streptomyces lunaelactis]